MWQRFTRLIRSFVGFFISTAENPEIILQQNIRDMGNQVRDAAQEKFDQLRDQASEYYEQGRERAREWEQSLESYVQDQPLKSLLIAAGIGTLIGFLYRRS
jgi:ElaB/YqjD/DUF883 family membrane-anchored ribosome-binding protein